MGRTVKTFRVAEPEEAPEPYPFVLEFQPADPEAEVLVERFEAYGKAPVGATLAMSSMIRYGARGRRDIDMNGMMEFFERAMPPEDYTRLRDLFDDPKWTIDIDLVGDVFSWLTEEYSGRPTKRSRRSSRTGPDGGRTVLAVASEPLEDGEESGS